jgi:hypothetical protein
VRCKRNASQRISLKVSKIRRDRSDCRDIPNRSCGKIDRSVRRGIFNITSAISTLILIAVGFLWPASYWGNGHLEVWRGPAASWFLFLAPGRAVLFRQSVKSLSETVPIANLSEPGKFGIRAGPNGQQGWVVCQSSLGTPSFGNFGTHMTLDDGRGSEAAFIVSSRAYFVPYWCIAAGAWLLPAIWFWRWRQWKMRLRGLCVVCGYDLRATPDRCPECGAVPAIQSSRATG